MALTRSQTAGKKSSKTPERMAANKPTPASAPQVGENRWTFLTNHAHVLILLSQNHSMVLREVASAIGITERAVQRIIADLEGGGFVEREKIGRQNRYQISREQPLRHPIESHRTIGDLLSMIGSDR
jgi:DNA-binding transcriptional ArsR family regulator